MKDTGAWIVEAAHEVGLDAVGVCAAQPSERAAAALRDWVDRGFAADMAYLARPDRLARLFSPETWDRPHHALLLAAASYHPPPPMPAEGSADGSVRIAAHACGPDYHRALGRRLDALAERLTRRLGPVVVGRSVDTAPILERDAAARAGLGFIGRNAMLIHPRFGSWLLLGELRLARSLPIERAPSTGTCGQCRRCLDECPTRALVAPYVVDSRRCISYLTIEHRGWIPLELRPLLGNWVFGCDACALVCPYNQHRKRRLAGPQVDGGHREPRSGGAGTSACVDPRPSLTELMALDETALLARYRGTPVRRAGAVGLLRNLCIAAGNWAAPELVPALRLRLAHAEPMVRGHAAWALGRIGDAAARRALAAALRYEDNGLVRREIVQALDGP